MSFGGSGSSKKTKDTQKVKKSGRRTEQLELDQAGVDKIIQDVLGGAGGLADIFSGEQTSGIFGSSVAAQAAGDLAANLAGEIAKITGKKVIESDEEMDSISRGKETNVEAHAGFGPLG